MKTATKVKKIIEKIDVLCGQLADIRESCTHPNATGTYESDTGNWDKSQDTYWIECVCPDCGKHWLINSDEPEYQTFTVKR